MNNIKKIIFVILMLNTLGADAQQESIYTQYMYNTNAFNPAYAGSRGATNMFALYRNQWLNQIGSPKIGLLSIHSPINERIGLGATFQNEKEGPTSQNSFNAQFSYNIPINDQFKLYFGVNAGFSSFNLDLSKLNIYNINDPSLMGNTNSFIPKFGGGLFLASENEYFGISIPNLLQSKVFEKDNIVFENQIHTYAIAGKVFKISDDLQFKPSVLGKFSSGTSPQFDFSANFLYKEKLNLGAIYRWDNAYGFLLGYQLNNQFFFGYSIDILTSRLNQYNSGSHEVFVRYEMFKNFTKIQSPRFF
jgi:type IX secretion system PorP/SprF family membrane protein